MGAAYCSGVTITELEQMATRVRFKDFARWTLSRYGFASNERMIKFLSSILKVKTFEELLIPLAVTATDFSTGAGAVFHSGPLVDPVRASCAYPGMFLPVKIRGRLLVDGMLAHAVPTIPLREMGAQRVLAVHLRGNWANGDAGPRHLFDVIGQCFAIAQEMNCGVWKAAADLVIDPDVNGFKYDDFERSADLIRAGEAATRQRCPRSGSGCSRPSQIENPSRCASASQPQRPRSNCISRRDRHRSQIQSNYREFALGQRFAQRSSFARPDSRWRLLPRGLLSMKAECRDQKLEASSYQLGAALLHHSARGDSNIVPAGILHQIHHLICLADDFARSFCVMRIGGYADRGADVQVQSFFLAEHAGT